ncbi:unnamed protein product, partial [Heterotrigona itama]
MSQSNTKAGLSLVHFTSVHYTVTWNLGIGLHQI